MSDPRDRNCASFPRLGRTTGRPGPSRLGVSLLELVIACLVFSLTLLGFIQMLRSTGQRTTFTSHTLGANRVASKVVADLQEETRINGRIIDLFEKFPELGTRDRVVEAQSVYFRHLHDLTAPAGVIQPSSDGGLQAGDGDLYQALKSFSVTASGRPLQVQTTPGFGRHVAEIEVKADWTETGGPDRGYDLDLWLPNPTGPSPYEPIVFVEEGRVKDEVRRLFFPEFPGKTFDQAVSLKNADPQTVLDLGRVAITTNHLINTAASLSKEIETLRRERAQQLTPPQAAVIRTQKKIAGRCEAVLSLIYLALKELEPVMASLKASYRPEKLGTLDPTRARAGCAAYHDAVTRLPGWVGQAVLEYDWLLNESLTAIRPARTEEFARIKALDAFRLAVLLGGTGRSEYEAFVKRQAARMADRNPTWEKILLREAEFARQPAQLKGAFENLGEIVRVYEGSLQPYASMAARIGQGGAP